MFEVFISPRALLAVKKQRKEDFIKTIKALRADRTRAPKV